MKISKYCGKTSALATLLTTFQSLCSGHVFIIHQWQATCASVCTSVFPCVSFFSVTTDWGPFPRTSAAQMEIEDGIAGAASQGEEKDGVSDAEFEGEGDYEEGFFSDKWLQGLRERGDVGQRETYT